MAMAMQLIRRRSALLLRRPPPGVGGGGVTPLFPASSARHRQAAEVIPSRLAAAFLSSSAAAGAAPRARSPMIRSSIQGHNHRMFSHGSSSATTATRTTKICRRFVDWFSALEFQEKVITLATACLITWYAHATYRFEVVVNKLLEAGRLRQQKKQQKQKESAAA